VIDQAPDSEGNFAPFAKRRGGRAALLCLISAVVLTTAVRIEMLNRKAGDVLPRRELRDDGALATWREALWTNEMRWRQMLGPRDDKGRPVSRELTKTEQSQMVQDMRRARAKNALRKFVSSWGLAQYVLVPAALALGLSLFAARGERGWVRALGGAGACVAVAAGALLVYRAYCPSLGW
jgi:hypothetical protein